MTGGKQPPRGDRMGTGTGTKGRLGRDDPPAAGTLVGNKRPPYDVVGLDALSPLLEYVDFPASRDLVADRIGHVEIPVDKRSTRKVREVLDHVAPTRFNSPHELHAAVAKVWDRVRPHVGEGRGGHQQRSGDLRGRPGNE